jgi:phage-related tail protein
MESHGSYRGDDWSPERLMFHQNLETFAERVGLIVGLQGNGKITQEEAYAQIKRIWKSLKQSKDHLINQPPTD